MKLPRSHGERTGSGKGAVFQMLYLYLEGKNFSRVCEDVTSYLPPLGASVANCGS